MYNYLYDGQQHTDISIEYLKKLDMDEKSIESLQQDANDYNLKIYEEMIRQRDQMLDENDWTILRHRDQLELGIETTLTDAAYKNTLTWRQQLRDMPQIFGNYKAGQPIPKWSWPPIPPELEEDFPDYPPE